MSTTHTVVGTPHHELFELAVLGLAEGVDHYRETDERFVHLVETLAVEDDGWLVRFLSWLRGFDEAASAAVVGAAEMVRTRLAAGLTTSGGNRAIVSGALQRADEPGELLAYWFRRYGKSVPKPIRHGIADAVTRLYDERSVADHDVSAAAVRFADVINLVHPRAATRGQREIFQYATARRGRDAAVPAGLSMLHARSALYGLDIERRRAVLDDAEAADRLREAGMTADRLPGWLGGLPVDARAWTAILPLMDYRDRLAHLGELDSAGLPASVRSEIGEYLANPAHVIAANARPLSLHAARREASSGAWDRALDQATDTALGLVPALPGRTLILIDRSASMFTQVARGSAVTIADQATVFGVALALRAADATLVQFGTGHEPIPFTAGEPVAEVAARFGEMGDGNAAEAVRACFSGHSRVVIVTDEPDGSAWQGEPPSAPAPLYVWNVASTSQPRQPSQQSPTSWHDRHVFSGLTDTAFDVIPLLESASWPF